MTAILPKLYCLRLSGCGLTDQTLDILNQILIQKAMELDHPVVINLDGNEDIDISKWKGQILRDNLLVIPPTMDQRGCIWTGIWKGDYGGHGIEYQYVHEAINDDGSSYLVARKITGDANVPLGKITWKLKQIPSLEMNDYENIKGIKGCLQVRANTSDPHGFQWDNLVSLVAINENQIRLRWRWWEMVYDRVDIDGSAQHNEEGSEKPTEPPISSTLGDASK